MPDAQGNYAGDWGGAVLPDNTQNIIHYADQYQRVNQQRALAKAKLAEENLKQNDEVSKIVGSTFDQKKFTNQNPLTDVVTQRVAGLISKYQKELSDDQKKGNTANVADYQSRMGQDFASLKQDYDFAGQRADEIKNAIKNSGLAPREQDKAMSLAMNDGFNTTDPTNGKVTIDPSKWNRSVSGGDIVNNTMEKNFSALSTNDGLDAKIVAHNKELESQKFDIATHRDSHGKVTHLGYKASVNPNEAVYTKDNKRVFDENGSQIPGMEGDHTGVRTQQTFLPNGQPAQTVLAQDIEDSFSADPQMRLWAKTKLANQIGEANTVLQQNNKTRQAQGLDPLSLITGDSEQAKNMLSKIYYDKYTQNMPSIPVNKNAEDQRSFENDRQKIQDNNAAKRIKISEANSDRQEKKMNLLLDGKSASASIDDFLSETDKTYGKDIKVVDTPAKTGDPHKWNPFKDAEPNTPATFKSVRIIPENVDPRIADIIAGKPDKNGVRRVPAKEFTDENGETVKGWPYDAASGNASGADDAEISNREVQRDYLNHNKKGVIEKLPKEDIKPKVTPTVSPAAAKIKGTNKKLF